MDNDGMIEKTIQRSNLWMMVLAVLGVFAVLVAAAMNSRYLYNFVKGPFPISQSELVSLSDPSERLQYYVTVQGDNVVDTGFQLVTTLEDGSEQVDQYYFALKIADRWLLVQSTTGEMLSKYSGALILIPAEEKAQVVDSLESQVPELKGTFLPLLLQVNDFREQGYGSVGLCAGILILSVFLALLALWRSRDPANHPIMKALAAYGEPSVIAAQIDSEMSLGAKRIRSAWIGSSWLVQSSWFRLSAMRFAEIVWIYKKVIQHRTYGVPTGKFYMAVVIDQRGKTLTISADEAAVDEILQTVSAKAPWAFGGYNNELATLWRKDRQGFINMVNQRRNSSGIR